MALSVSNKKEINEFIRSKCEDAQETALKLLCAPEVCCMVESLTLFARCAKPINLISHKNQEFLKLKNPQSLSASIYQVTTAFQEIFRLSATSMNRIFLNLEKFPTYMNGCLEALKNPDANDSQEIINWALPGIRRSTQICVDAANEPYEKVIETLKLIQELHQAVLTLRDSKSDRIEKNKEEMDEQNRLKEQNESELQEIKAQQEAQKQIVENARESYIKTLDNNNEISLTVFTMIMDNFSTFCHTSAKIGRVLVDSSLKYQNNEPPISREELIKLFTEDEVLEQATEKALFNIIEEIVEQKDEEVRSNILDHITNLKCATDYKTSEKAGKQLREKGKNLLEALLKTKENDTNCQEKLQEAKTSAKVYLKTYQEAIELKNKAKNEEKQQKAEMSRERQNLMQTRAENLKVAQEALNTEGKHLNVLSEKREKLSNAINDAINKISKLNFEETDLNEVLECLEEVIQILTSIQLAYSDMIYYFNYVKELIDGPLVTQIQDVTKFLVNDDQTIKSLTDRQQRILLTEVIKACSLSYVLMQGSKFYKDLSDKFIMPMLNNALLGHAIPKEEAKNRKDAIASNFVKVKYEVSSAFDSQNMQIMDSIYALLKKQGFDMNRSIRNS